MKKLFSALLAGAMLLAMGLSLAACGGQKAFYTLQEAYEKGIISYEDLKQIHEEHKNGSEFPPLSAEEDVAIRQSIFENSQEIAKALSSDLGNIDLEFSSPDEIEILSFYGCFQGCYVVYVLAFESALTALWSFEVEDVEFSCPYWNFILVWTNPEGIVFE